MSGGYPADVNSVSYSMALVSIDGSTGGASDGASGAASGAAAAGNSQNPQTTVPHPLTQVQIDNYGYASNGDEGALRLHEFKARLPDVFNFNRALGCIFTAKFNSKELAVFIDELYLSYLLVYKENPPQLNASTRTQFHDALFNPSNQYMWFKAFIVSPNLKYLHGYYGFPPDIGVKPIAKIWLDR